MNIVEWAFGKRMTPQERLRKHIRSLSKTVRELEREQQRLAAQEKKLKAEIKKDVESGQMGPAKIHAKDLVRTRQYKERFALMKTNIQALEMRIRTASTNTQMTDTMKQASRIMSDMNRSMNLPQLQRMAMEFEKENDIMDQRQEMMDDAIDEVTGVDEEEEGDQILEQISEEIGIDLKTSMGETPQGLQNNAAAEGKIAQAVGGGGADPGDDDLQARLNSLRR